MTFKPTVAIDLDGTLASYDGWRGPGVFGTPLPGAKTFLETLRQEGWRIVIHTSRVNLDHGLLHRSVGLVEQWLRDYDLPYDEVWTGIGKPSAFAYVDDRAVFGEFQKFRQDFDVALKMIRDRAIREGVFRAREYASSPPDARAAVEESQGSGRFGWKPGFGGS